MHSRKFGPKLALRCDSALSWLLADAKYGMTRRFDLELLDRRVGLGVEARLGDRHPLSLLLEDRSGLFGTDGVMLTISERPSRENVTLPAALALCTQLTSPYGATSQRRPSSLRSVTGVLRS